MNWGYFFLFLIMCFPALLAVAIAPRSIPALIWNNAWFLIFAKVGQLAFDSVWGALPAFMFAIQYAIRSTRPRRPNIPPINFKIFTQRSTFEPRNPNRDSSPNEKPKSQISGEILEAEFRRES